MSTFNDVSQFSTFWTIWLGLIGQTAFCVLFATRPWRQYRITRAYFSKSWAMEAIFLRSAMLLTARGLRPGIDDPAWVAISAVVLNAFVLWAIYYQLVALALEIHRGQEDSHAESH